MGAIQFTKAAATRVGRAVHPSIVYTCGKKLYMREVVYERSSQLATPAENRKKEQDIHNHLVIGIRDADENHMGERSVQPEMLLVTTVGREDISSLSVAPRTFPI